MTLPTHAIDKETLPTTADEVWEIAHFFNLNWENVRVTTSFDTSIITADDETEHRRGLLGDPIHTLRCDIHAYNPREVQALQSLIYRMQTAGYLFPFFTEGARLTGSWSNPTTTIPVESTLDRRGFYPTGYAVVVSRDNTEFAANAIDGINNPDFQIVTITSVTDTTVEVTSEASSFSFPARSMIYPLIQCKVSLDNPLNLITDALLSASITAVEEERVELLGNSLAHEGKQIPRFEDDESLDDYPIYVDPLRQSRFTVVANNELIGATSEINMHVTRRIGIKFTLTQDTVLHEITALLKYLGSTPSGDLAAEIREVTAGVVGDVLCRSGNLVDFSTLDDNNFQTFSFFFSEVSLVAGDYYVGVLVNSGSTNPTEHPEMRTTDTGNTIETSSPLVLSFSDVPGSYPQVSIHSPCCVFPILVLSHNWVDPVASSLKRNGRLAVSGNTTLPDVSNVLFPKLSRTLSLLGCSRDESFKLVRFFESRSGRLRAFLLRELQTEISGPVSVSSPSKVRFSRTSNPHAFDLLTYRRWVYIKFEITTGEVITGVRKIANVTQTATEVTVEFTQTFEPVFLFSTILDFSVALLCRFDTDDLEESWVTNTIVDLKFPIVEVINEDDVTTDLSSLGASLVGWADQDLDSQNSNLQRLWKFTESSGINFKDYLNEDDSGRDMVAQFAEGLLVHNVPSAILTGVRSTSGVLLDHFLSNPGPLDLSTPWTIAHWHKVLASQAPSPQSKILFQVSDLLETNKYSVAIRFSGGVPEFVITRPSSTDITSCPPGFDFNVEGWNLLVFQLFLNGDYRFFYNGSFCNDQILAEGNTSMINPIMKIGGWAHDIGQTVVWNSLLTVSQIEKLGNFDFRILPDGTIRELPDGTRRDLPSSGRDFLLP